MRVGSHNLSLRKWENYGRKWCVPFHSRSDFSYFQPVFTKILVSPLPSASILRVHDQGQHTRWALVGSEWVGCWDQILEIRHSFCRDFNLWWSCDVKNPSHICQWFLEPTKVCDVRIEPSTETRDLSDLSSTKSSNNLRSSGHLASASLPDRTSDKRLRQWSIQDEPLIVINGPIKR